ncbi:MAG TPA: NUDIX domain-containing protein [Solirubrobacteraceae bacterium]|nr:NUDIX domain-containing protein [Solirubrobacteraceae bacterium]
MTSSSGALPVRRAARVLLVDPDDRLLLFRSRHEVTGGAFWYPVGGQVEAGESFEAAVVREAFEETGLAHLSLGPEVFRRRFIFRFRGVVWDAYERWWLARVDTFAPQFGGMEALESGEFADCRWMSAADLTTVAAAGDHLTPATLLSYLPRLLTGELTGAPYEVGD